MRRFSDRIVDRPIGVAAPASQRIVEPPAGAAAAGAVTVQAASGAAAGGEAGGEAVETLIGDLPDYANDGAAASGGVPVGGLYRNGNRLVPRTV